MLKGYSLLERICLFLFAPNAILKQLTVCFQKKICLCTTHYIMDLFNFQVCLLVGNATCFIWLSCSQYSPASSLILIY